MSSGAASGGRPDHEEPGYPHGSLLRTGSGLVIPAGGTNLPWGLGYESVAGYRSLVVQVKNNGPNDVQVIPRWNFIDGASAIDAEQTQSVKAGTSKRLIFQNHGDIVNRINIQGGGGGTTIDYSVAPSNLDPLPSSAPDYLILYGQYLGVTNPPIGDNDHAKFDPALAQSNDISRWGFVLDAGGLVKEVDTAEPGRYESFVQGSFKAAGALFQKTMVLNVFGAGPIAMSPDVSDHGADKEDMFVGAFTELVSGVAQWTVQPSISAAGPIDFAAVFWWFKRWAI